MSSIELSSIYALKSREPMIHFVWGKEQAELSITEARAHALAVLEVAEAAVGDAFIFEFASRIDEKNPDQAGAVIVNEFRQWRQDRGYGGGIDQLDNRKGK